MTTRRSPCLSAQGQRVAEQRHPTHGYQWLGPVLGKRAQAGAEARSEHEGLVHSTSLVPLGPFAPLAQLPQESRGHTPINGEHRSRHRDLATHQKRDRPSHIGAGDRRLQ